MRHDGFHVRKDDSQPRRFVVGGELDLATVAALEDAVAEAASMDGNLTLDMTDVTFIDSSGIAGLVRIVKRLGKRGRLRVIVPGGMPLRTLKLVGIDRVDGLDLITGESG